MDLNLIEQRCAQCGARIGPGETTCHVCHQPAADPVVRDIQRQVEVNGPSVLQGLAGTKTCDSLACATLMLYYITGRAPELDSAAASFLSTTRHRATLRELVTLLGSHRWLGQPISVGSEAQRGKGTLPGIIRSIFSHRGDPYQDVLTEALHSPENLVREAAADLMQYQAGPEVVTELLNALRTDRDPLVRARAATALGKMGDSALVEPLVEALHDSAAVVQSKAAQALSQLGQGAVSAAATSLNTGDATIAFHSARLLGQVGSPEAVQALINSLRNRRDLVRLYAEQALTQIGVEILPVLLVAMIRDSDSVGVREGIAYILRTMHMPDRQRQIIQPVVEAAESINAALEVPEATYRALGALEGLTDAGSPGQAAEHLDWLRA